MFDKGFIADLMLLSDELVKEHGEDWDSMKPEEKQMWLMQFVEKNAHPIIVECRIMKRKVKVK